MHDKGKLATYIDITKQTILICWIALFSFWAIKLFGGNFFEILVENENFVKFSEFIQNSWLYYLSSLITISIANFLIFNSISQTFILKDKRLIYLIFSILSMWYVANFVKIEIIQIFYGYILIIMFGVIYQKSWKKLFGLLSIALEFLFGTLSLITRNLPLEIVTNQLIMLISSIDIYTMYLLYYLYSNLIRLRKEI